MPLTSEQARALMLLRQGLSTAVVAEQLGLPRPTVWRWQNELPEFADVRPGDSDPRPPLPENAAIRVLVTLVVLVLTALFVYLGYC